MVTDRKLANLVRRCQELPGQILFQWTDDDGGIHPIGSSHINEFLREITGGPFTAKDFRTWGASSSVAGRLAEIAPPDGVRTLRRMVNEAVDCAAVLLGNTRTVCRNSYVHPAVVDAYADGRLARAYQKTRKNIDLLASHECLLLDVI